METNEQGLTKNEKIVLSFLSIILLVAIGVLIINSLSLNERKLDETLTTEKEGQESMRVEKNASSSLKEDTTDRATSHQVVYASHVKYMENVESIQTKNTTSQTEAEVQQTDAQVEAIDSNDRISTVNQTWDFKDDIVTTAYVNDKIKIDEYVLLNNGREARAQLTVRKLVDNTYMIVDISSGYLTVSAGKYKY